MRNTVLFTVLSLTAKTVVGTKQMFKRYTDLMNKEKNTFIMLFDIYKIFSQNKSTLLLNKIKNIIY